MKYEFDMPETTFLKLTKDKIEKNIGKGMWGEYFRYLMKNVFIIEDIGASITKATAKGLSELWMENFIMNIPDIVDLKTYPASKEESSIGMLPKHKEAPALIVAAGPSIHKYKHLDLLAEKGFNGKIFTTDRMLLPLLQRGVIPDYVVTVDGNRELIVKWYSDPLIDRYGDRITGLFATTVANNVVKRFKAAGGTIRWFHGALDSFHTLDSVSSFMNYMTKDTSIQCGGNVGATCFTLAWYLHSLPIIFIGLDLGYTLETPAEETAYYKSMAEAGVPMEKIKSLFSEGFNPDFNVGYTQDMVFKHYRDSILEMIENQSYFIGDTLVVTEPVEVINATGGGALHGKGITGMPFSKVLEKYGGKRSV